MKSKSYYWQTNSWLTVSNQIVKSLLLCYKKSFFLNMVQPVDQICYKMIEIIKQNFFNSVDFYLGPNFLFSWPDEYFLLMTSPILNPKIQYIKRKVHESVIFCTSFE